MRRAIVAVLAGALCVALAPPALAKGPGEEVIEESATVQGRGLAGPIHLTSNRDCGVAFPCYDFADLEDPLVNLATLTGVVFSPPRYSAPTDVPGVTGGMGPRYRITYSVSFADGVTQTVRQDVYPWAGAGGWIFTPEGQRIAGRDVDGGWIQAPTTLRATLIDLGVPASAPGVGPAADAPDAPDSSGSPLLLAVALLGSLALGGALIGARAVRGVPRSA